MIQLKLYDKGYGVKTELKAYCLRMQYIINELASNPLMILYIYIYILTFFWTIYLYLQ